MLSLPRLAQPVTFGLDTIELPLQLYEMQQEL